MAETTYLKALVESIKFIYNHSGDYFVSTEGRERSMVFRIAHRLANKIEGKYEDTFVDLEPTKCNGRCKTCRHEHDGKEHRIYPDLIIHQRNITGYMVVEFKCSEQKWEHDENKLKCLTTPKENNNRSTPFYKLGAFVYLANELQDIEIHIYKNGKKDENLTKEYQIKLKGEKYAKIKR